MPDPLTEVTPGDPPSTDDETAAPVARRSVERCAERRAPRRRRSTNPPGARPGPRAKRPGDAATSGTVYARIRTEQDRIRRDHRTAQERRQARQRARQRCEDLTELLGRMALPPRDPDQAADLLRRTRAAAHEIEGLVTGRRYPPRQRRLQRITPAALHRLDVVVEELDEAVRDALDDEWNTPDARSLALDLTAILVAGVDELCRVEQIA